MSAMPRWGPFERQQTNLFSAVPGGFVKGAGHGNTITDLHGNYWHVPTVRISVNHDYERRIGLFLAGFDDDGVMFCNQNFACYPRRVPQKKFDPQDLEPEWMLLSYGKQVYASSVQEGCSPDMAVDENSRTWWGAATSAEGEWVTVDLGKPCDIRAVQINLADENIQVQFPAESYLDDWKMRHIDTMPQPSRCTLEYSTDNRNWTLLRDIDRESAHYYVECEGGVTGRYVRAVGKSFPYGQPLRISGLRVFGNSDGPRPAAAPVCADRAGPMDAVASWQELGDMNAQGCNVRYGTAPDKLYMSWLVFGQSSVKLSTLIEGQDYYIAVDSFNENGITPGKPFRLELIPSDMYWWHTSLS